MDAKLGCSNLETGKREGSKKGKDKISQKKTERQKISRAQVAFGGKKYWDLLTA